ncbi:MAG: DUF2628 domain-containing protein [Acetobacteraceae bacterium]|jgi:hypothetical protein
MKVWTAHEKPNASPVLVREGFSFGALFFGPIWLAAHQAWLPAIAMIVLTLLTLVLTHPPASIILILGLALLAGFSGRDLVRWSVTRRGYLETSVITGRNQYDAQARLLAARPDLVERSMVAETAP